MKRHALDFKPGTRPWIRGEARIRAGKVILDEETMEKSWPWTHDYELAFMVANIRSPEQIPPFAQAYGLLWHGPGSETFEEPVDEWLRAAQAVRSLLTAAANLEISRDIDNEDWVEAVQWLQSASGLLLDESMPDRDQAREVVSRWIGHYVSEKVKDVRFWLANLSDYSDTNAEPGEFAFTLVPNDLEAYAYWQVGSMLSSQRELRRCDGCSRLFTPKHPKQKFHDQACGNRNRQRRFAARKSST